MYVASVASGAAAYLDCCCHRYPHCHHRHRHHHYHIRMTLGTGAARININNNMTPPQAVAKKHDSAASAAKCILCVNSPTVRRGVLDREQQQRVGGGGGSVVELTQISCPCQLNLCMQNSLSHMHTVHKQTHIHTYNCISLVRGTC